MEKEFIPYEQALALKELGFNEPCFATYRQWDGREPYLHLDTDIEADNFTIECDAPLYQQAFRWFREKHNLDSRFHTYTHHKDGNRTDYMHDFIDGKKTSFDGFEKTYGEAELACLVKLIDIVKNKYYFENFKS